VGHSTTHRTGKLTMSLQWYVVHAYSGFENQVKRALEERIKRAGMDDVFGEILVPTEEVVEMREGSKRRSERKFFPGYVLVQMDMSARFYRRHQRQAGADYAARG
jgi:transcription antitermination factor NusG